MRSRDEVKKLIEEQRLDEAEAILEQTPAHAALSQADIHYLYGLLHSKRSDWASAKGRFLQAYELEPDGPAGEALNVLTDIYDFYYKDLLNP